jgi:hypothetical protein
VEAYINDVVIKTENFIKDLQLVFNSLRRTGGSLTQKSVSSEYRQESYSNSLSATEELKLTQKGRGHHKNGSTTITEKGADAYWMHGSPEQVHIKARRERHVILQIAQKGGQVSVNHGGT